ncbi:MAG: MCE family protein [Alphaproteobacteria bacterium]|nr:MCE family protein [Alphaproteobacteria bacterium]
MTEETARERRTRAIARKSRWPGWIWAVPVAALGVVAWLLVRTLLHNGTDVTVDFERAAGLSNSSKVTYLGVEVGKVKQVGLSKDRSHVVADITVDDSVSSYLTTGTTFYMKNVAPSLTDLSSLKSVVAGPTIVMVPGRGESTRHFSGRMKKPAAAMTAPVRYLVHFDGDAGSLEDGADVTLRGFKVGQVVRTRLMTDLRSGAVSVDVVLALDAARFHASGNDEGHPTAQQLKALVDKMVQNGLRARLTQSPPLIGGHQVVLAMVPDAEPVNLALGSRYPEIPSVEGGGLGDFAEKLGRLPITQIGENVRAITREVRSTVSSPKIDDSLRHLDRTLAELDKVVHQAGPQVAPTIRKLRQAADQIDATATEAKRIIGGNSVAADGTVHRLLDELTGTARAVRSLADYLDRHPEALIKGR